MNMRAVWAATAPATVGIAAVVALILLPAAAVDAAIAVYVPAVTFIVVACGAFLVWRTHPAYTLSAAIFLTPLAGHWEQLGVPGPLSPDRLLFVGAILAVLLRAPPVADRPPLRITGAHWLLGLALAYALFSALFAGTLFQRAPFLQIFDSFGILPFLVFLVGPVAFSSEHHRRVLLGSLVALGAYLSVTVLFDAAGLDALVFPRYILDPDYGLHAGRGRGPFVDAVASGLALYTCAVACAIAAALWRTRAARAFAVVVGLLCIAGAFLSMERSVWIGVVLATTVSLMATRQLRRRLVPVVLACAVTVGATLMLIPGMSERFQGRLDNEGTIWDRKNLNRAAVNMVKDRPLTGFGWSRFTSSSTDYFEQASDYPLTASRTDVHNTPLIYAVELGLIGTTLWLGGLVLGVGGALATRGPPDVFHWRVGLLAIAIAFLVVVNAVPPTAWANRSLWVIAAVAYSGRYAAAWPSRPEAHATPT